MSIPTTDGFLGLEKRRKRLEIYAARMYLIKHLVGLSDQSKRKKEKKLLFIFFQEYIQHNTHIPIAEICPVRHQCCRRATTM